MQTGQPSAQPSVYRVLTTVNAPRALHIDAVTLVDCLLLRCLDQKWRPHVRSYFQEVGVSAIHDMVIEGVVDFDGLVRALETWGVEEFDNARWIREMAGEPMA